MIRKLKSEITFLISLFFCLLSGYLAAQDTLVSTNKVATTTTEEQWYLQPWVWIVGGAVLLLILIAMFSGNKNNVPAGRTDRVTVTKTVRTETDVDS